MPPRHYRYLTKYYDEPPRGFLLFNSGSKFQKTGSSGFKTIKSPATEAAADLKSFKFQWLGTSECLTWDNFAVYNKGKLYTLCEFPESSLEFCFIKNGYLIALCNINYSDLLSIRIFALQDLSDSVLLNTPDAEFADVFNGFSSNGYEDITVNKTATTLVLIGLDADTTSYPGAVIQYSIGAVSVGDTDWFTFASRYENSLTTGFKHFCYWNPDHTPDYAVYIQRYISPTGFPDTYLQEETTYRGKTFFNGTIAFGYGNNPLPTFYVSQKDESLAIGINRYIDDVTIITKTTNTNIIFNELGNIVETTYVWTLDSIQTVFEITLPAGNQPLNEYAYVKNHDSWILNWSDMYGNMLYALKTPNFYVLNGWTNESDVKIFKSGFVAESVEKQTAIEAVVLTPANVKGVI